jgi:superfamily I DNA and/or RNA helicase
VFLGTSYRLHPDVCKFGSESFYEGKLQSAPSAENHRLALPENPGAVPIESSGLLSAPRQELANP